MILFNEEANDSRPNFEKKESEEAVIFWIAICSLILAGIIYKFLL